MAEDESVGVHGMALLPVGERLIASHMPLHGGRHGHQILLEVSSAAGTGLRSLIQDGVLVSAEPERFSLKALQKGEIGAFSARIYRGHFERGGAPHADGVQLQIVQKLLDRPLVEQKNGHYRLLHFGNTALLVHEIGTPPSFDQILEVESDAEAPSRIHSGSKQPLSKDNWPAAISDAGIRFKRVLYLETRDFQQP